MKVGFPTSHVPFEVNFFCESSELGTRKLDNCHRLLHNDAVLVPMRENLHD
jgi:hypothetical protein